MAVCVVQMLKLTPPPLVRPSVRGGGVRLAGEPEGVPPRPAAGRAGVLERHQAGFSGQPGDQGAGVCCVPGGSRDGVPRLQEGQLLPPCDHIERFCCNVTVS